jgi:N-acetylmuramoyl-L-alanine amidase
MTRIDEEPTTGPTSSSATVGRRMLLGGAVATTLAVGGLALLDRMPYVRDLPIPGRRRVQLTWLADELRSAGLRVQGDEGWLERGRPWAFDPVGVLMHHTAFRATGADPQPALATVRDGRPGLRGPLCHVLVARDGTCHVIYAGRANHAGEARPSGPVEGGDGNASYVGIEIDYAPQQPFSQRPTAAQLDASVVAAAAIVARLGNGADHVRYHSETSLAGKWDPGSTLDADAFRARVAAELDRRA